jgi:hypothetical protein
MPGPLVPVLLGGGFLAALFLLNKKEKESQVAALPAPPPPTPPGAPPPPPPPVVPLGLPPLPGGFIQSTNIAPAPRPDGSTLSQLAKNPDGSPHVLGTPFISATNADAKAGVDLANKLGLAVFEVELLKSGAKLAKVTTNDPPPSGDLIMRLAPNESAAQVPGGGASKNGLVTLIRDVDGTWSEIFWHGDGTRPLAQGFAKRKFLVIQPTPAGLV